jgi:outer membrane protein assembly factor BamB
MRFLPPRLSYPVVLAALISIAGCSKDKDVEPPARLVNFPAKLAVSKIWGEGIGGGKKQRVLRLGLGPTIDNGLVFAASHQGEIIAVDLVTGHRRWNRNLKLPLSGGPSARFGMVVVGSSKGDIVALDAATGRNLWSTRVNGELLAAAAISEKVVVIRAVDGKLHGLDAASGASLWSVEQQVPRLSLRGTGTPIIAKDMAICGFDNGKVMAVGLATGDTVWDTALASPHGRTELERLVDIDSSVSIDGDNVYAVGFQGRAAMLALDSGQIWWAHDLSSNRGLAVADDTVYVSGADGVVFAMRGRDGSEIWHNDKLKRRGLSAPVITSTAIAVGDYQGYVHWLDKTSGELVARERVANDRITSSPAVSGEIVVVLTDTGRLAAFRSRPRPNS